MSELAVLKKVTAPHIELELLQGQTEQHVRISVRSQIKPKLFAQVSIPLGTPQFKRMVAVAAGACAERLCERYDDIIDPDSCANEAQSLLDTLLK